MPRGGRRPGAGRPTGSRDGSPRRQRITPLPDPSVAAILDYAKARTEDGSLVAVLEGFRESTDPEHRKWWAQVVASYGVGLPGKRSDQPTTDIGSVIAEAARHAQARHEERRKERAALAPAPEALNSGQQEPREVPALPPAPPAPVLPPEPARAEKGPDGWPRPTMEFTIFKPVRE